MRPLCSSPVVVVALALVSALSWLPTLPAQVVISEFMARNGSTIDDEDGDSSDWIELYNSGSQPVNLFGWRLTDDVNNPLQFALPVVTLSPGEHLIVFASGKNRAFPGQELHANFKLSSAGEYLALRDPTGTVATEFSPSYPPQRVDVSFGTEGSTTVLVQEGDPCEALVPLNGTLGSSWHQGTVSGWLSGVTPVGYERGSGYQNILGLDIEPQMYGTNASAYVRIPFMVTSPATVQGLLLRMKYDDGFAAWINGVPVATGNAPASVQYFSTATANRPDSEAITFEDFDATVAAGSLLPGQNVLAIQGLNVSTTNIDYLVSAELVAGQYGTQIGFMQNSTPGAVNDAIVAGFVDPVTIDEPRGYRTGPTTIALTCPTAGASIRYTTDGSRPTDSNGTLYSGPITISSTTVLRARGFLAGFGPSSVSTRTYLYSQDVFAQTATLPGWPSTWGGTGSNGLSTAADYGMDPSIINDPSYSSQLQQALKAHPIVSLSLDAEQFLDPATGIYISPTNDPAVPREAVASVEYFEPAGAGGFQVDAGVRVSGNNSTRRWGSKKLSLRLLFKEAYGASKLDYPLFDPPAVSRFNTLTLDAYFAFSWNYAPFYATTTEKLYRWRSAQYLRDHYAATLHGRMGAVATHGRFVHLLINGRYWGLYNLHERPDAEFQSSYLGGDPEDWDVIRHNLNNVQDGNNTSWLALRNLVNQSGGSYVTTPTGYAAVRQLLDVESLADYMILNFFIGFETDWPGSNWYAARNRNGGLWRMISWDAEHTLKSETRDSTNVSTDGSPARLYHRLRQNPEFQLLFADRVHRFFFNQGPMWVDPSNPAYDPLNPDGNQPAKLYAALAREIENSIILESARWGDAFVTSGPPYTVNGHWKVERDRLLNSYFLGRRDTVLQQLRAKNLYPSTDAPVFNQHGGAVPSGFGLTVSGPAGATIWVTTDGSDPRLEGGAVSPTAVAYSGPITLTGPATVSARALIGSSWSALNTAAFQTPGPVINELLADNVNGLTTPAGLAEDWVEIFNPLSVALDLSDHYLSDSAEELTRYQIPTGTILQPGDLLLLWADDNPSAGALHMPFRLDAQGESLFLTAPDGITIRDVVHYGPQSPDVSTGRREDGGSTFVSLLDPSPLSLNAPAACGVLRYDTLRATATTIDLDATTPTLGSPLTVTVQGPALSSHRILVASQPSSIPVPGTSLSLLIGTSFFEFAQIPTNASGTGSLSLSIPNDPTLMGAQFYVQAYAAGSVFEGSNALRLTICP